MNLTLKNTAAGQTVVGYRGACAVVDGLSYDLTVLADDGTYTVWMYSGRREKEIALRDIPAGRAELLLAACEQDMTITGSAALMTAAAALPDDTDAILQPLRDAAVALEILNAPAKVRAAAAGTSPAAIRAAAQTAREEKQQRHAARDAARAEKAAAAGISDDTHIGDGWELVFDQSMQRTRLCFTRWPGKAILTRVKAAGFAYNAAAREWRRGLNNAARAAALELVATL